MLYISMGVIIVLVNDICTNVCVIYKTIFAVTSAVFSVSCALYSSAVISPRARLVSSTSVSYAILPR